MDHLAQSTEDRTKLARVMVDSSNERGITLRIMGGIAFIMRTQNHSSEFRVLHRNVPDIDFVAYLKQQNSVNKLMEEFGFKSTSGLTLSLMPGRSVFVKADKSTRIDIFYDKLEMCHTIDLRKRLEIDYPTISLSDLLLQKLQIVQINEKDLIDCVNLLGSHEVDTGEKETINADYIAKLVSDNWGFNHTIVNNLQRIDAFTGSNNELNINEKRDVRTKITRLRDRIEREPKSLRWKMRAKLGEKKIWYDDVEFRG